MIFDIDVDNSCPIIGKHLSCICRLKSCDNRFPPSIGVGDDLKSGSTAKVRPIKLRKIKRRFSDRQLEILQAVFNVNKYPSKEIISRMVPVTGIDSGGIKSWFQRERAKKCIKEETVGHASKIKKKIRNKTGDDIEAVSVKPKKHRNRDDKNRRDKTKKTVKKMTKLGKEAIGDVARRKDKVICDATQIKHETFEAAAHTRPEVLQDCQVKLASTKL